MRVGQALPLRPQRELSPLRYSACQPNRSLRAVLLGVHSLRLKFAGDVLDQNDRVPDVVGVENVRRQRVTAPVSFAALCIDTDASHVATGKVRGSDSTERSPAV